MGAEPLRNERLWHPVCSLPGFSNSAALFAASADKCRRAAYPDATAPVGRSVSKTDRENVLERIKRLNELLDEVESVCFDSAELRTTILKARVELQAAAKSLRFATPQDFTSKNEG